MNDICMSLTSLKATDVPESWDENQTAIMRKSIELAVYTIRRDKYEDQKFNNMFISVLEGIAGSSDSMCTEFVRRFCKVGWRPSR